MERQPPTGAFGLTPDATGQNGGARCAVHPDQASQGTCTRCGSYMCATCESVRSAGICEACEARGAGFALNRQQFDLFVCIEHAFGAFRRDWLVPTLIVLVGEVGVQIVGAIPGIVSTLARNESLALVLSGLSMLLQMVVRATYVIVVARIAVVSVQGRIDGNLSNGLSQVPASIAQSLLYSVGAIVLYTPGVVALAFAFLPFGMGGSEPSVMLIAGGGVFLFLAFITSFVLWLGLMTAQYELAIDLDCGPIEAIQRTWRITAGYRGWMFVYALVSLGIAICGLMLLCIGVIPATALTMFIGATVHQALRNGLLPAPTNG